MRGVYYLRCISGVFERLLHRILQRFFGDAGSPFEMLAGDLQVVLLSSCLRIADPLADGLQRKLFGQFGLARRSQVLEHFRPRLQASPADNAVQLRPQILVGVPVAGDDEFTPRFGLFECLFQVRAKFREHRNQSAFAPGQMFRLRTTDQNPAIFPIHVGPSQGEVFRRATEATESAQSEDQTPFGIRAGVDDLLSFLPSHEVKPFWISDDQTLQIRKRVLFNQFLPNGGFEELFRPATAAANGVLSESLPFQVELPRVGVSGCDCRKVLVGVEELQQTSSRLFVKVSRSRLHGRSQGADRVVSVDVDHVFGVGTFCGDLRGRQIVGRHRRTGLSWSAPLARTRSGKA